MTDVPSPTKVLVIDDEEDIRDACKAVLEKDGLCVFTASDGKGGIEIFGRELPAVVLVDLKIPGMSGLEVVDHIRGVDETVVNVVITGYGTVENAVEAMKKGVYEFLSKPFTPDQLRMVVKGALERFRILRHNKALAEERERIRRNLLSLVSHELRSPIAVVIQYLDVLLGKIVGDLPQPALDILSKCKDRLSEMLELIGKWITLATFDASTLKESFSTVQLGEIVEDVIQCLRPEAESMEVSVSFSPPQESVTVMGSRVALSEVIRNIVSNAIKYNRKGGRVSIDLALDHDTAVMSVKDTGPGIPEEHLQRIFDEFYRVDGRRTSPVKGSGLGLAIVKKLVESHGGKVQVYSKVGEGSNFIVTIPISQKNTITHHKKEG